MSKTFLIIDTTYLCYRSFYSTGGGGKREGLENGVVFGILRDIPYFQELHNASGIVFCFDHGISIRSKQFLFYKKARQEVEERDWNNRKKIFLEQIKILKETILKEIGFKNIFYQDGYEADDFIASSCFSSGDHQCIIIGSDRDFFQLLSPRVIMWNPVTKQPYTEECLLKEYGVTPKQWVMVKAIAGCRTDGIPGVKSIGEKSAANYITGKMGKTTMLYKNIEEDKCIAKRNITLVQLPYPGTPIVTIKEDRINPEKWRQVMDKLQMKSIREKCPLFF